MNQQLTERLLLVLTVIGFIVPNVLLGIFIADEGFDVSGYFSLWTDSTPSTQITPFDESPRLKESQWIPDDDQRALLPARLYWIVVAQDEFETALARTHAVAWLSSH